MRRLLSIATLVALTGCIEEPTSSGQSAPATAKSKVSQVELDQAVYRFRQVVRRMEPVAERECRARVPGRNCDFKIVVDDRPNLPSNAYQTEDKDGRPVIGFTLALLAGAQNSDEIAFVLGHEAAHHISGHVAQTQRNAAVGGFVGIVVAAAAGVDVGVGADLGSFGGARSYSKQFELEADALGTIITHRSGYDPVRGSKFFGRIPDPGDRFLGSHPPNDQRLETVRKTAAQL